MRPATVEFMTALESEAGTFVSAAIDSTTIDFGANDLGLIDVGLIDLGLIDLVLIDAGPDRPGREMDAGQATVGRAGARLCTRGPDARGPPHKRMRRESAACIGRWWRCGRMVV